LDNFVSAVEAVNGLKAEPYQLLMAVGPASKKPLTVHLTFNHASGDSAVVKYIAVASQGVPRLEMHRHD
jgi:hypothetical protein